MIITLLKLTTNLKTNSSDDIDMEVVQRESHNILQQHFSKESVKKIGYIRL